ncbi:MAG: DNA methyltransferase [Patescibacteria group bacterium]|nr:DNA methyltransferase [Patescibacteria group bacterium]
MLENGPFAGLEKNGYAAILADPPWRFNTYNEKGRNRCPDWKQFKGSPSRHYETMSIDELCLLPINDISSNDCCLFLWISWPMLQEALTLINQWGFSYKTCAFCWVKANVSQVEMFQENAKVQIGTGYWTRSNSEVVLLCTKGNPKRLHADVRQAIVEPRRAHSRKPDCIHERIERLVGGPYLEMFARQSMRKGWTFWGNQTDRFNMRQPDPV